MHGGSLHNERLLSRLRVRLDRLSHRGSSTATFTTDMTSSTDVVEVPYDSLQPDILRAVVEEFITRNGTDYGERERTLEEKIADVMGQLRSGEATVVFDRQAHSVNIVPAGGAGSRRSR
jgi:uncharacterized protein YheU (UPF0270 family)